MDIQQLWQEAKQNAAQALGFPAAKLRDDCDEVRKEFAELVARRAIAEALVSISHAVAEEREACIAKLSAAPIALMDTRAALGLCALAEEDFEALYALQGHRVALVDLGPNVELTGLRRPYGEGPVEHHVRPQEEE